jgi:LPXTG-motif cell wall-anchored protein
MPVNPSRRKKILSDTGAVLLGTLFLCSHAVYNGFPIIYPDSGTYISACFEHFIPIDRPLAYCFFVRHTSLAETPWLPVIFQSMILSWLILLLFRHIAKTKRVYLFHLASVLFLSLATGVAVVSGQLFADVFTPILVISSLLLLFADDLSKTTRVLLFIIFSFSVTTHLSHFPLAAGLIFIAFTGWFFRRRKKINPYLPSRIRLLAIAFITSILFTFTLNYAVGGKWQFRTGAEHVFMMNRLIECHIVGDYLEKNCGKKQYSLCGYGDLRNFDFLWSDKSPLNTKYGWANHGWLKAKPEYDSIIGDIFSNKEYVKTFAMCSFRDAMQQLVVFKTDVTWPELEGSAPYVSIGWHFPRSLPAYVNSRQNKSELHYEVFNVIQNIVVIVSTIVLLFFILISRLRKMLGVFMRTSLFWIIAAMLLNAFTVVTFAMVDRRYQARLIWLLPLLLFIIFSNESVINNLRSLFGKKLNAGKENNSGKQ